MPDIVVEPIAQEEWTLNPGVAGPSAYQVAIQNGYEGTEQEWLDSLIGPSAYEIAVADGYGGTEQQWLESLKAVWTVVTQAEYDALTPPVPTTLYLIVG